MNYCQKCVLPETRPNLVIDDDGVCNACKSCRTKMNIDWKKRERAFHMVVENAKALSQGYDCLVPVSGGKDSFWQVVKCLEYGLKPLAVTWKTPARTELGRRNLENLVNLGVDHIDYQISPEVERKFMYQTLVQYGSTAIPMHMAIFNIPLKLAIKFKIPLVIWGENSAVEYGGTENEQKGFTLDNNWVRKFGVTNGTTAEDWVSDSLSRHELTPYFGPADKELENAGVLAVFLGYYFSWDVTSSLRIAEKNGFRVREEGPKTGYYNYADIDDNFISIHHWLKWYKFGFTRLWDNLSLEIRNERMTRNEAVQIIRERGDDMPNEDIEGFCEFVGTSRKCFNEICEEYRNRDIWLIDDGTWKIKDFLISDWKWQ